MAIGFVAALAATSGWPASRGAPPPASPPAFVLAGGPARPTDRRDGMAATDAKLTADDVAVRADGTIFIADAIDSRVLAIDPTGRLHIVAGTGRYESSGDGGPATRASVDVPSTVAVTPGGELLIGERDRVRRVRGDGTIETVAGNGRGGFSGDGGPATAARLGEQSDVIALPDGSFLIADAVHNRVRRVDVNGRIDTIAGTGKSASRGDGGPARNAAINAPTALGFMPDGSLLIAESEGHRIRRVSADGRITTIAGGGREAARAGEPARDARLDHPFGVAALADGSFAFDDGDVWRVSPDGTLQTALSAQARDFAGRGLTLNGATPLGQLTAASDGSLLFLAIHRLLLIGPPPASRLATSLVGVDTSEGRVTASLVVTSAATATLTILRRGRRIGAARQALVAGPGRLSATGRFAPGAYTLDLHVQDAGGRIASDSVAVRLGGRLVRRDVRARIDSTVPEGDEGGGWEVGRCESFGPRRTDCDVRFLTFFLGDHPPGIKSNRCSAVDSVLLPPSGILEVAQYACPRRARHEFIAHPNLRSAYAPFPAADLEYE